MAWVMVGGVLGFVAAALAALALDWGWGVALGLWAAGGPAGLVAALLDGARASGGRARARPSSGAAGLAETA